MAVLVHAALMMDPPFRLIVPPPQESERAIFGNMSLFLGETRNPYTQTDQVKQWTWLLTGLRDVKGATTLPISTFQARYQDS